MPYRIAHAQKSLSLVVKHLWAHGLLPEPPLCPVDRRILKAADPRTRIRWTCIDSMQEYNDAIAKLRKAADSQATALAVWELQIFSGCPVSMEPGDVDHAKVRFLQTNTWAAPPGSTKAEAMRGALKDALKSSHTRAHLYANGLAPRDKKNFLEDLRSILTGMANDYPGGDGPLTERRFKADIQVLASAMNRRHGEIFG